MIHRSGICETYSSWSSRRGSGLQEGCKIGGSEALVVELLALRPIKDASSAMREVIQSTYMGYM